MQGAYFHQSFGAIYNMSMAKYTTHGFWSMFAILWFIFFKPVSGFVHPWNLLVRPFPCSLFANYFNPFCHILFLKYAKFYKEGYVDLHDVYSISARVFAFF